VVGLIDKIPQRLAGIAGKVSVDGHFDPVLDEFLQNLPRQAGAEDEKVLGHRRLVHQQGGGPGLMARRHGQLQGRRRIHNALLRPGQLRHRDPVLLPMLYAHRHPSLSDLWR